MAFGDFEDSNRKTAAEKVLDDKAFDIAENLKCNGYQDWLLLMIYKIFGKKTWRIKN